MKERRHHRRGVAAPGGNGHEAGHIGQVVHVGLLVLALPPLVRVLARREVQRPRQIDHGLAHGHILSPVGPTTLSAGEV